MKVRSGSVYVYRPAGCDIWDPKTALQAGDRVRVKSLPGCPPANTMGHAHVVHPATDKFIGLVLTASLHKA